MKEKGISLTPSVGPVTRPGEPVCPGDSCQPLDDVTVTVVAAFEPLLRPKDLPSLPDAAPQKAE